ncbi:PD-(D/E)XK motif protein [Roseibium aestuarii]|uniref:PD-(D/E)XK motif protein n=1 Tax=Roseibium aestuarii TaxID=2600299 RepID=A0ABW4JSX5_9HYPH|nr:PD-(D/E)XK motif protein [Roseibium aestuarii]
MKPLDPWEKLEPGDARRVDSAGKFDFFWALPELGMPGLMLRLASLPRPLPQLPKLKDLQISFRSLTGGAALFVGLKDLSQLEVFQILCRDVVAAGEVGVSLEDALSRTIRRLLRWHRLMRGGRASSLTLEEQQGLVGELTFLREVALSLGPQIAINAWTGPRGAPKDFEFTTSCVEIKTKRAAARPFVSISSEHQLADVPGCRLYLRVTNITSVVSPEGENLHDHVRATSKLFENPGSIFDMWEETLFSTGYDPDDAYDERRWVVGNTTVYEVRDGFPRIAADLPHGIENVRYQLALDACTPFEISQSLTELVREGPEQ